MMKFWREVFPLEQQLRVHSALAEAWVLGGSLLTPALGGGGVTPSSGFCRHLHTLGILFGTNVQVNKDKS